MSYRAFFSLSTGLKCDVVAPTGTLAKWQKHVKDVEATLGLIAEQYLDNPAHWQRTDFVGVADDVACRTVAAHNRWVRFVYDRLGSWMESPVEGGETITPAEMDTIWHGLALLDVEPGRWTLKYYRERAEHLYEVMRGRASEGVTMDAEPLTERQAAAVTRLFSEFLDTGDLRLDVPVGHDRLASSYDGGYTWCEHCGPIDEEDSCFHLVVEGSRDAYCGKCGIRWAGMLEPEEPMCEHLDADAIKATPDGHVWCNACREYRADSRPCAHLEQQ